MLASFKVSFISISYDAQRLLFSLLALVCQCLWSSERFFLVINHSTFAYLDTQYVQYVRRSVIEETCSGDCVFK